MKQQKNRRVARASFLIPLDTRLMKRWLVPAICDVVLCLGRSSWRSVRAQLPDAIRQIIRMQGALPKMEIVARHKAAIDRGDQSIIFGL